jgi:hypothetical protein
VVALLVHPPKPIEVRLDDAGVPCYLRSDPLVGDLRVVARRMIDLDWWGNPVWREYWRVILREQLLCEIFRDLDDEAWYVEYIYD